MTPITMNPSALFDAATQYETARNDAESVIRSLTGTLDDNWGCSGTDGAGARWAGSYDIAAFDAVSAGTHIVNAFGKLHDLLAATGVNHANTEKANTQPPQPPEKPPPQLGAAPTPSFRGSYGGGSDAPPGWELIARWLQGYLWPNGDPESLRALGTAWSRAAQGLRSAGDQTGTAWADIAELASDELPQALAQMDGVYTAVDRIADQYEQLGVACDEWAQTIDDAHQKIFDIIGTAIVVGAVAGVVAWLFTLGSGTVAVTGATGSAIAASVVVVLGTVDVAAAAAVGITAAAGAAAAVVANELQPLLDAGPTPFEANISGGGTQHHYYPAPRNLTAFPDAVRTKPMNQRSRWTDKKGTIYEWDYQHGAVEKYNTNGKRLGEFEPDTGVQTKPADPTRRTVK